MNESHIHSSYRWVNVVFFDLWFNKPRNNDGEFGGVGGMVLLPGFFSLIVMSIKISGSGNSSNVRLIERF